MNWAIGGSACSRRSAGGYTRRGAWRTPRSCARSPGFEVETMWTDDGFVIRYPDAEESARQTSAAAAAEEWKSWWCGSWGHDVRCSRRGFAKRRAGAAACPDAGRSPGAALAIAQASIGLARGRGAIRHRFRSAGNISRVCARHFRSAGADRYFCGGSTAGPFGGLSNRRSPRLRGALLFRYVANYIYEGDAPLAERRAQALSSTNRSSVSLSAKQSFAICSTKRGSNSYERELQILPPRYTRADADGFTIFSCPLAICRERRSRALQLGRLADADGDDCVTIWRAGLRRCALRVKNAFDRQWKTPARFRDALGAPLPNGVPGAFAPPVADPLGDLLRVSAGRTVRLPLPKLRRTVSP